MPALSPRRVLVLGASGVLGTAVRREAAHHPDLLCVPASRGRRPGFLTVPYADLTTSEDWVAVLREHNVESVVNCAGIWQGSPEDFEHIQYRVPVALGLACAKLNLHLVHVAALGARAGSPVPYAATKARAARFIVDRVPGSTVVYPSLLFGPEGQSTRFLMQLAALPVHFDLGYPKNLQPVHVDDVARAIVGSLRGENIERCIECAGRSQVSLREYLAHLREGMGLGRPRVTLALSRQSSRSLFTWGERLGARFVNRRTWQLLSEGVRSQEACAHTLPCEAFATPADGVAAVDAWLRTFTRLALGTLWLGTAVATWRFWPHADSLDWLSQLHPALGTPSWLAASCLLDATMGLASVFFPSKRLWKAQFWLTLAYSLGWALSMPQSLVHPLGALTKNLCVLAAQAYLALHERK
jgi:uncharacterized protein YbjT (DUF2867 family)